LVEVVDHVKLLETNGYRRSMYQIAAFSSMPVNQGFCRGGDLVVLNNKP